MQLVCNSTKTADGKNGITLKLLQLLMSLSHGNESGAPPTDIDLHKHENPYFSKYGDEWESVVAKSKGMKHVISIHALVWHMYTTMKEAFENRIHRDDFFFYHDTFSLMTSNECLGWMREKNILKSWILPEMNLNSGT
eukprot:11908463-Ditylum_brightwellii.AAC.1